MKHCYIGHKLNFHETDIDFFLLQHYIVILKKAYNYAKFQTTRTSTIKLEV